MARTPRQPPLDFTKPIGGDRIEQPVPEAGAWNWGTLLTVFMRVVGLLWLAKGIAAWSIILGIWDPSGAFETGSSGLQTTIIYFAAIDTVAAVGLWMASTWGGVLWLLAVMSHLVLSLFFPDFIPGNLIVSGLLMALVAAYLVVSWLSAQDE